MLLKGTVQLWCKQKRKFIVDLNGGGGHPVYQNVLLAFGLSFFLALFHCIVECGCIVMTNEFVNAY